MFISRTFLRSTVSAFCSAVFLASISQMTSGQVFKSDIVPLNKAFDQSRPSPLGRATLLLDTSNVSPDGNSGVASLKVNLQVHGLDDLTGLPGATHVAHIHGQFAANDGLPAGQQVNGPFFSGEVGTTVASVLPSPKANDTDENGYLDFFEGLPEYGPVVLNLSDVQVPHADSGTPPLIEGINTVLADNGIGLLDAFPNNDETFHLNQTYTFNLADADARRQFNNLIPLTDREIVVHGLTVPDSISDPLDAAATSLGLPSVLLGVDVGDQMEFRTTAPAAAGVIRQVSSGRHVPEPTAFWLAVLGLGGVALCRYSWI